MAFATSPWYAGYARLGMAPFGLTPAQDQQIAGLIMWVPGGLVHAVAALCLFVTSMIGGALGALMALSDSPWYPAYGAMGLTAFGLSPTEDQQLAGLIMWVPGGLFHLAAALLFVARWLSRGERRDALATD
jgi:cytochrome c oxidase assembly factor CtaG